MSPREYVDTGYVPIDFEHRALSVQLRAFVEQVNGGRVAEIREAMQRLLSALADHFAHEERLMARHGFPNRARHCEAHQLFLADAGRFAARLATAGVTPEFRRWAVTRLLEWFRFHIMANDMELGRFLLQALPGESRIG
jgi:hemerythrin